MDKHEFSLLLYLETRAVDHGGRVDARRMNADDLRIAKEWNENNFISFGRVVLSDVNIEGGSLWVYLSDAAWKAAHDERRRRAERSWENRKWKKTSEKNT